MQPFRDGVAWVRRPGVATWELIDEAGARADRRRRRLPRRRPFSDGLAWVSRDGAGGWFAIDRQNRVVIPAGFDDVRPFRRGLAAVRRGRLGRGRQARPGRGAVRSSAAFATALTDGRYVDGFTDEGLAVVDAGGRKGVVDRTGQLIVPPVHPRW